VKRTLATPPRTWVFTPDERLHLPDLITTCLLRCTTDHDRDQAGLPDDIWCEEISPALEIRVTEGGEGDDAVWTGDFLKVCINRHPFSHNPQLRQPYAIVEVAQEQYSQVMDADELAELIAKVEQHVEVMKTAHAHLIEAVTAHEGGGA
jgi:hypothetical protein